MKMRTGRFVGHPHSAPVSSRSPTQHLNFRLSLSRGAHTCPDWPHAGDTVHRPVALPGPPTAEPATRDAPGRTGSIALVGDGHAGQCHGPRRAWCGRRAPCDSVKSGPHRWQAPSPGPSPGARCMRRRRHGPAAAFWWRPSAYGSAGASRRGQHRPVAGDPSRVVTGLPLQHGAKPESDCGGNPSSRHR